MALPDLEIELFLVPVRGLLSHGSRKRVTLAALQIAFFLIFQVYIPCLTLTVQTLFRNPRPLIKTGAAEYLPRLSVLKKLSSVPCAPDRTRHRSPCGCCT